MEDLNNNNIFQMSKDETKELQNYFSAIYSDDTFGTNTIKEFLDDGYLMDPHTATCIKAYNELKEKPLKTVLYSTAEWTKFSPTVLNALKQNSEKYSDKEALEEISSKYNATLPQSIKDLFNAKINHSSIVEKENIESEIVKFIRKS
jgi:threonine synthase